MSIRQKKIIQLLSRKWNYYQVAAHFNITIENLHTQLYHIRKITGIKSTKDAKKCTDYLYGHGGIKVAGQSGNMPTQAQMRCMVWLAQGRCVRDMGAELGVASSTVRNHLAAGMKTAGIKRARLYAYIRDLGLLNPPITMDDPAFN